MKSIVSALKKILLKSGFTVLRGNIRQQIIDNKGNPSLPPHLLTNAIVLADRVKALDRLPKGGVVIEVGVGYGAFSQKLLDKLQPSRFIAIDTFAITPDSEPWKQTHLKDSGLTHLDFYTNRFQAYIDSAKMEIKRGLSWEVLAQLPDTSVDYIYVDADHSYESVVKDIDALLSKLKPGAIIQFNDYTHFDQDGLMPFGVPKAVNEFMIREGFEMLYFCLHPDGFHDVVVRERSKS
jgi:Methyltransferase domain